MNDDEFEDLIGLFDGFATYDTPEPTGSDTYFDDQEIEQELEDLRYTRRLKRVQASMRKRLALDD